MELQRSSAGVPSGDLSSDVSHMQNQSLINMMEDHAARRAQRAEHHQITVEEATQGKNGGTEPLGTDRHWHTLSLRPFKKKRLDVNEDKANMCSSGTQSTCDHHKWYQGFGFSPTPAKTQTQWSRLRLSQPTSLATSTTAVTAQRTRAADSQQIHSKRMTTCGIMRNSDTLAN